MCFGPDARPPYPPIRGGSADATELTLRAADGNEFMAFEAKTDKADAPGILILPDVRGLHGFYEELAVRFAEAGVNSLAIDYFGRTAGVGSRGDEFDFWPHVQQTKAETVALDAKAGVGHLRDEGISKIFTVGFCFGGRASFNQAAEGHGLAGVIGFYGKPTRRDDTDENAPIEKIDRFECPVLGLFGGADQGIPPEDAEQFAKALESAGIQNDMKVYEGAPHSFFDRSFAEFKQECDDAWRRILTFMGIV